MAVIYHCPHPCKLFVLTLIFLLLFLHCLASYLLFLSNFSRYCLSLVNFPSLNSFCSHIYWTIHPLMRPFSSFISAFWVFLLPFFSFAFVLAPAFDSCDITLNSSWSLLLHFPRTSSWSLSVRLWLETRVLFSVIFSVLPFLFCFAVILFTYPQLFFSLFLSHLFLPLPTICSVFYCAFLFFSSCRLGFQV